MNNKFTQVTRIDLGKRTVSFKLSPGVLAALESLPGRDGHREIFLQWALAEGIAAMVAHHDRGGRFNFGCGFDYAREGGKAAALEERFAPDAAAGAVIIPFSNGARDSLSYRTATMDGARASAVIETLPAEATKYSNPER
jgi:hypothetical protein